MSLGRDHNSRSVGDPFCANEEDKTREFRQAWIDSQRADRAVTTETTNLYFHIRDVGRRAIYIPAATA